MRSSFLYAFVLGFCAVLAASYFVPWAEHARVASKTSVAMNGGRRETFMIYLPADRIVDVADARRLPVGAASMLGMPEALAGQPVVAEHFKLRDVDGTVIGLAMRHWSSTPTGATSVWTVSIPSRGTLVLAADGDVPSQIESALAGAGVDSSWSGELEVAVVADDADSRVLIGTEEFAGYGGRYVETWQISGFNESGDLRATIILDTVVSQS